MHCCIFLPQIARGLQGCPARYSTKNWCPQVSLEYHMKSWAQSTLVHITAPSKADWNHLHAREVYVRLWKLASCSYKCWFEHCSIVCQARGGAMPSSTNDPLGSAAAWWSHIYRLILLTFLSLVVCRRKWRRIPVLAPWTRRYVVIFACG